MSSDLFSWRKWPFWLGAGLLLIAFAIALAWLFRVSIARQAMQNWCTSKDLVCEMKIESLGFSGAGVRDLRITNGAGETPFEAGEADVALAWKGLFNPVVTSIRVDRPVLRGSYGDDNSLTFGGLEKLGSGSQSSGASPSFEINDARVELVTPAGPVAMYGQARGQMPLQVELDAEIEPVELETGDNRLVLREGRANLSVTGIKISGTAELDLAEARFDGLSATGVRISANMADDLRPTVDWTATVDQIGTRTLSANQAKLEGSLAIRTAKSDDGSAPWLSRVHSATMEASAQSTNWMQSAAEDLNITLEAHREFAEKLGISYGLVVTGFDRPEVEASKLTASGNISTDNELKDISASSDLSFGGTSLKPDYRRKLLGLIHVGSPFDGHSDALASALYEAFSGMSGGTGLQLTRRDGGYWSVVTTRAVAVNSANGASFTINPQNGRPVLNIADEASELSGLVALSGPGLPKLVVDLTSAQASDDMLSVETGGVTLSPWTVNGLSLATALNELSFERAAEGPRLKAVGELRMSGALYGLTLDQTRLFGGIDAAGGSSLRVQTYTTRCLGFDTAGIRSGGGYAMDSVSLQLCPRDGRLVRPVTGGSGGTVDLGAIRLPFSGETTSGDLSLENAVLDWTATKTARLTLTGDQMSLPMNIGSKTLTINSAAPSIRFETTRPGSLDARLGASQFGGTLVPADIAVDSLEVDWTLPPSGIEGTGLAKGVEVRDRGDDPLYVPLRGDLDAKFSKGVMSLTGPITTRPAGQTVANFTMNLDLAPLDGTATITTPDLVFAPRRFQPTALSERVRGFLSNARGTLRASASFDINGGRPSGTGWVSVEDFGFDTLRLGAVNGVNGRIDFNDIMSLSTSPGQVINIGEINPGIPLQNGRLQFQLTNGVEADLEEMRWPFAGGQLISGGSHWTIAGTRDIIEVTAQSLELADLVSVFKIPDLKAEGTVTGTFPVEFVGPNTFIRNASLKADSSGGTIAYTGEAASEAAKADERVSMAFEALKDFDFTVLELNANGNLAGDILITMRLVGKSPKVLGGAPFAFNIGVDSKLMQLIQSGRSLTTSDWLTKVIADPAKKSDDGSPAPGGSEQ